MNLAKYLGWGIIAVVLTITQVSCAPPQKAPEMVSSGQGGEMMAYAHPLPTIFHVAEGLAAQLKANLRDDDLGNYQCIVTTIVDIDDLTRSSRFGRLLAEALGSEIFRQGGNVVEIRSGRALMVAPKNGELTLTRDAKELSKDVHADSVVVGTYAVGESSVAVTIRLLDIPSNRLLSVAMTELARTPTIDQLLYSNYGPIPTANDHVPD